MIAAQAESSSCAQKHSGLIEAPISCHCAVNHIPEPIDAIAITGLT
jgi:hypothetical protein